MSTPWLFTSTVLYVLVVVLGLSGYTPTLNRQIHIVENGSIFSESYTAVARRGTLLGIALIMLAVAIIFLRVVKPPLWA